MTVGIMQMQSDLCKPRLPCATVPRRRIESLVNLQRAGIPTGVMFAPVIPALNDTEMENIIGQAADAGVINAG